MKNSGLKITKNLTVVFLWTLILFNLIGCEKKISSVESSPKKQNFQKIMEPSHDHGNEISPENTNENILLQEKIKPVYTCPMHPQIKLGEPGRCPICGMELVLSEIESDSSIKNKDSLKIDSFTRRVAGIETDVVVKQALVKKIKAVGMITYDESRVSTIAGYVGGRIEKLYADYTGVAVKKGQHLARIYSPELLNAQIDYLSAKKSSQVSLNLVKAAKNRLKELGMTISQISRLDRTRKAESRLEIYAPLTGTVITKGVETGTYIKKGQLLFKIADLSTVWLKIEAFPEDASLIHYGQQVEATIRSNPGKVFKGRVAFIEPVIDPLSRTVIVRVEMENKNKNLRPGDYSDASLHVPITPKGDKSNLFDPKLEGKWISPMHPQIIRNKPGKCPICGMKLVPAQSFGYAQKPTQVQKVLAVPRDAVLMIGNDSLIFVEETEDIFKLRKVTLGSRVGNLVVISKGLEEFETIATDGVFLLDSQMQLSGKTSLIKTPSEKKK